MRVYEVIVGNVGSVYHGKNRAEAIKTYRSYVRSSREIVGARCYGEDVNLLVDGEIEQEHTGHLREYPIPKRRGWSKDRLRFADNCERSPQVQELDARRIVITSNSREHPMALIERDGKVYARKLWIFMGPREWGNDLMRLVAREAFASDTSLDAVQVHEHAGWYLTFLRDGTIVGTANDQAHLDDKATEFLGSIYGYESAGEIRRP